MLKISTEISYHLVLEIIIIRVNEYNRVTFRGSDKTFCHQLVNVFIKLHIYHHITNVKIKQRRVSNSQREYIRGIIQNLSLQRWSDYEIANFLNDEKGITLSRSAVTHTRIRMERQA